LADEDATATAVATPFGFARVVETITKELDRAANEEAAPVAAVVVSGVVVELKNIPTSV
jgi:hypothetical protein